MKTDSRDVSASFKAGFISNSPKNAQAIMAIRSYIQKLEIWNINILKFIFWEPLNGRHLLYS